MSLLLTSGLAPKACAGQYQRNGRIKELPRNHDRWFFTDHQNWYIKAPDKWTHFMGSYALTELTGELVHSKVIGGLVAFGLGALKEHDDAFREGWSRRDLYMDFSGVMSSMVLPENVHFLAYYDNSAVIFKLSLII